MTKTWVIGGDEVTGVNDNDKMSSITYTITRGIWYTPEGIQETFLEDQQYNDVTAPVTVSKEEAKTAGWGYTWNDLDAYGPVQDGSTSVSGAYIYTVKETEFVYDGVPYEVVDGVVSVDESKLPADETDKAMLLEKAHQFWKTSSSTSGTTTAITNTLDETFLEVIKKWRLNGGEPTADSDDSTISEINFYLWRSDNKVIDKATMTAKANEAEAQPFTITKSEIVEDGQGTGKYEWTLRIDGLEKTNGNTPYTYWIEEVAVPGYSPKITLTTTDGAEVHSTAKAPAESKIVITNSKFSISLPSTGGQGTTMFYIIGSVLTLLAAVLLITKKRSDVAGIE